MYALLDRIGWSKSYFAAHMGVTVKTVYNWEESRPPAAMKYLETIARLLGV